MIDRALSAALVAAGLVHLIPAIGALGAGALERVYGVAPADPTLLLLLRHRAVLFGVLGAFMMAGAFAEPLRWWSVGVALLSMCSFVALAWADPGLGAPLVRVLRIDLGLTAILVVTSALHLATAAGPK